jgi:hypothetical protein
LRWRIACCDEVRVRENITKALILTHPFEGGHPDHDATALAVRRAVRDSRALAPILEFTGYHLSRGVLVSGRFLAEQPDEVLSIELTHNAYDLKSRMIDCFTTQSDFIRQLMGCCERFRYAPTYNFRRRPHTGPLFYETWESGMRWEHWLQCVDRFGNTFHDWLSVSSGLVATGPFRECSAITILNKVRSELRFPEH